MAEAIPLIVGITGASGSLIAQRTVEALIAHTPAPLWLIFTETALRVWQHELPGQPLPQHPRIVTYRNDDLFAPPASGSCPTGGMVVVPCSMGSLAKMAHGMADTLLGRAADVTLKERRPLIVVPRESPLSGIHLSNMLTLAQTGATIVPPMLTFYHGANSIEAMVDDLALHIVALLGYASPRQSWDPLMVAGL